MRPLPERLPALALAAVLTALPALAQEDAGADPWYRVELLVFRYTDPAALEAETWPVYPETAYPERYRFLVDRALADRRLAAHPEAESRIDDLGRQRLRLAPPAVAADPDGPPPVVPDLLTLLPLEPERPDGHVAAAGARDPNALATPEPGAPEPGAQDPNAPAATAPDPNAPPPLPPAFTALDARALPAGRLARDGGYEVLWHEAWLQPLRGEADAVPLLLDRSGDPDREPWPRLQGSVRLYLSRYLHLETALWLNTEGSYLPEGWQAEAPPLAPPSLALEAAPLPRRDPAQALLAGEPRRPDARLADGTLAWDGPPRVAVAPVAAETAAEQRLPRDPNAPQDPNAPADADAPVSWPWRHSIVLAAERRMRSGETHYLDHPLFGVVVRLEPLEPEELEALGEELADPAWAERHGRAAARPDDAP
ncbi:CsiV family protein [Pseudohaliea sp.]|uniref:CsiV family protein n=1 Tax=Pseudohaliea sp. TaxID=2740289 RepID=UPI0032EDB2C9